MSWLLTLLSVALPVGVTGAGEVDSLQPVGDSVKVSSNWQAEVLGHLQQSEYEISWQTNSSLGEGFSAWQSPNRANDFRTYFTEKGTRVIPRQEETPSWEWGLSLLGYGRRDRVSPVGRPTLSTSGNRADYDHGSLLEWYVNEPRGLEHGFTIQVPPESAVERTNDDAPLPGARTNPQDHLRVPDAMYVVLQTTGTLSALVSSDGQAVDFRSPDGIHRIRYAQLEVRDATGTLLPSFMEMFGEAGVRGIRLVVEDADATYPLHIDPLASAYAWTAESDQASALFGIVVSTAGDVNNDGFSDVIVGAIHYDNGETDEGRAFVYYGSASGPSTTPDWTAEGNQAYAAFGSWVSTAGDVNGDGYSDVGVGAYLYDDGEVDEGGAFVYYGSASGLSLTPDWTAYGDQAGASFGHHLSTVGDVNGDGYSDFGVGATFYDDGQTDEGRAYLFLGSPSGLSATPDWTFDTNQAFAEVDAIAAAGDVNGDGYADLAFASFHFSAGQANEGRVFLFHGSSTGPETSPSWTAEGDQADAWFGHGLGTAGDVNGDGYADLVIGALQYDAGQTNEGRAFVYLGSATGLSTSADWTAEGNQSGAYFGYSAGTAGDVNGDGYGDVIVGATGFDNGQHDEGRAFVYCGSSSGLSASADWTAESNQADAYFGRFVSTAGDVNGDGYADLIIGADYFDNGELDEGRAFVYLGAGDGLNSVPAWTAETDQAEAGQDLLVASAGDVNGDGFSDVLVSAWLFDNGEGDEGRVFLYHGSASGLSASPNWTAEGDQEGAGFGIGAACAGDVNGDGFSDVVIGAWRFDDDEVDEGRAYVYHGSATGLRSVADWTADGNQAGSGFGHHVGSAGDVNGDGYSDVAVAATYFDNGETDEGRVFVYHGSSTGLSTTAQWTTESDQADAHLFDAASAGDVNGDGYSDLLTAALHFDNGEVDEGRVWLFLGSPAGLVASPDWTAEGNQANAWFGHGLDTAGDVNGDGFSDIIIGAPYYDNGLENEGRAFVYHGSATGLSDVADWTSESNQAGAEFGIRAATAGDVNGDGYADVVVGARLYDAGQTNEGRVYVFHGSSSGLSTVADWTMDGNQAHAAFGRRGVSAGDVNGDGFADVLIAADLYDGGQIDEGRAYLFYGGGSGGLSLKPKQVRSDGSVPIAHLGASDAEHAFRLSLGGSTPYGRGEVKFEWEVKPLGEAFNGQDTGVSSEWVDTGIGGTQFDQLVTGLDEGEVYHWRVRLYFNPVFSLFQSHGRWLTIPLNGWQEADLRTPAAPAAAGRVPDDAVFSGTPLTVEKAPGEDLLLQWGPSCLATDADYSIYEGTLGSYYSHYSLECSTGGATSSTIAPGSGSTYYLIVPRNDAREGSYGIDGSLTERPQGSSECLIQEIGPCP